MLDFDAKEYAGADLRTVQERILHCRLQSVVQILSMIISGVLIVLTVIALNYFAHFAIVTLLTALILSLCFSIFLIYWGFSSARLLRDSTDLYQGAVRPFNTLVALLGSLIFATVAEVYTFIGWYFKRWFVDNQVAQASSSASAAASLAQWQDYFDSFFIWFLILSFIQFVIFLYSAFAAYICIPGESTLRRVFAVANLAMCTFGGLVLYLCYVCYDYISLGNLVNLPSKSIVDLLWWIALVTIIASIFGILINLRRSKVLYFILGGALLICWAIAVTQVPSTLRQERQAYGNAFPNCQQNMQQLHKDFIKDNLQCSNKYLTTNDCSKDARAYNWEQDEGKSAGAKTFSDACLNRACCGVITNSILNPFAKLGVWGLFWVVAIAVTSAVAIKIARRNGILTPNLNRFVEYLCGGLQFVTILLFLILILTRSSSSPKLNPASSLQQSANTDALPLPPDQIRNYPCLGLNLDAQLDSLVLITSGCVDDPTCANQGIRLGLYTDKFSQISLPSGYQNDTLRFLNPAALDPAGEFAAKGEKISFAVEGSKDNLKKFFKEDARVCIQPGSFPADATKDVNATVKLKWRQVTLSNSLKITDPLLSKVSNDTKSADIKQPDQVRFQATQNPWSAINYTLHGVLQKVATDANGNALLTPFKKLTPSGQTGSCNYARKVIPYPYSEDLTWDDKNCDVDWLPITLDDVAQQEGAFLVPSLKLLQNYQPYAVRFFVQCFEFDKDKYSNLREYEAYKDILIGGYPRISTQDLGVIVLKRTDFKTDQVALGARRVLAQVEKFVPTVQARTLTAKPVTYEESGTAVPAVVPTPKSTLTVKFVDATTNKELSNGGAFVTPVREYPTGKQVKDGFGLSSNKDKSLVKCVTSGNLFKDQMARTSVRQNVVNGTSTVTLNAGFHNITAARIVNTKDYNYHTYNNPNFLAYGRSTNLPLTVPLVPRASNSSQIQILLEWGSQTLDLDIFVTFNVAGGQQTCLVGYSQKSCGGATFHVDNWNGSEYGGELVTINLRNDAVYLVYVKAYTGSNTSPKAAKTLGKEPYYSNPNGFITDSFARVSVFVNNINETAMSFPVPGLNKNQDLNGLPVDSANKVDKTKLIWQALCIKGSVGARSIVPLGKFWKPSADKNVQAPTNADCENYYKTSNLDFTPK